MGPPTADGGDGDDGGNDENGGDSRDSRAGGDGGNGGDGGDSGDVWNDEDGGNGEAGGNGEDGTDGGANPTTADRKPAAAYVFRIRVHVEPAADGVWLDPSTFETTAYRRADPVGEPGWRYFRDNLWRGECGDDAHLRALLEESLGVPVRDVAFRELRTSRAYLDELRDAIAADLDPFNASSVDEVLSKYLGSSIHVTDEI